MKIKATISKLSLLAACALLVVFSATQASAMAVSTPVTKDFSFTYDTLTPLVAGLHDYTTLGDSSLASKWQLVTGSATLELFFNRPTGSNAHADILTPDGSYLTGIGQGGYSKVFNIGAYLNDLTLSLQSDARYSPKDANLGPLSITKATFAYSATATPVPAAIWLLGYGLVGLVGLRRKFSN